MIVHDFCNKKLKKLCPDFNFELHLIRNKSDLKLETFFLICGTLLYLFVKSVKSLILLDVRRKSILQETRSCGPQFNVLLSLNINL